MILTAILFGLSYKWKWAMAVFAGVIGAFGGIILMSLLYLTVGTLVVGALCHLLVERGADPIRTLFAVVVVAAFSQPAVLLIGGIGGVVLGIHVLRWRRWRSGRDRSEVLSFTRWEQSVGKSRKQDDRVFGGSLER